MEQPMVPLSTIETSLGAAFLGSLAASVLYGITSVQTFLYFRNTREDGRPFRLLIFVLWFLDTLHLAFTAHGLYFYLVTCIGNPRVLLSPTWTLLAQVYLTCLSDLAVRSVFARRVWLLSGGKRMVKAILPLFIVLISLFVFACGVVFASKSFIVATYARMGEFSYLLYCSLGGAVAADVLVTVSLCALLFGNRTGFKRTDSLVTTLMAFTINTGLLTSICAIACLVTYALWPERLIFMGVYFALSKLYVNSLLASLNARAVLRDKGYGVSTVPSSIVATPFSCYPPTTSRYSKSQMLEDASNY